MRTRTLAILATLLFAFTALVAGCGSSNDDNSGGGSSGGSGDLTATPGINVTKDPKIDAEVPKEIS